MFIHIYNVFIIISAIIFSLAVYKLKNSSLKLVHLLDDYMPFLYYELNIFKKGRTNKSLIFIVLIMHIIYFSSLNIAYHLTINTYELLDEKSCLYIISAIIISILLIMFLVAGAFCFYTLKFSYFVLKNNIIDIKRKYVELLFTYSDNLVDFINQHMSYDAYNKIKNILKAKYLDESICEQLILIDNLCIDDTFKNSKAKEVINFAKSLDELVDAIENDYIRNKNNDFKKKEEFLIKDLGLILNDIAKGNEYLKNVLK